MVELGADVDDGRIVVPVTAAWFDIVHAIAKDPSVVNQLDSRQWELMLAGSWERAGATEVIITPQSGDFGRDVVATFRLPALGIVRIIDQMKAYSPGHLVTANDVRAFAGVLSADNSTKGFVTTTSSFAPRLRKDRFLKSLIGPRLELVDRAQLLARLKDLAKA